MNNKEKQAYNRKYRAKLKKRKRLEAADSNGEYKKPAAEITKEELQTELNIAQKTVQFMSQKLQAEIEMRLAAEKAAKTPPEFQGMKMQWVPADETIQQYDQRREQTKAYEEDRSGVGFGLGASATNPKTLMGQQKVPMLSVIPPASLIHQGIAMRYGAHLALRADGKRGYGPYNWRDQPIEGHIYIDAAMRHLLQYQDGDDYEYIYDEKDNLLATVHNLGFALATIGILLDAIENQTVIDDRPKVRKHVATRLLDTFKIGKRNLHDFEPKK